MDPVTAALIGAGSQLLTNRSQRSQAAKQMAFQERMSNTSFQRQMDDMRKAGLNPILASKMGGASSPAGAMANIGDIAAAASNSAKGFAEADKSVEMQKKIREEAEAVAQTTEFNKTLHQERWSRMFATMGPENVLASVFAALSGVDIQSVLRGRSLSINVRKNLEEFVRYAQSNKSIIVREAQGVNQMGKTIAEMFNRWASGKEDNMAVAKLKFKKDIIQELAK